MSRAFVKEDIDPPERSGRVRSASGLPPGALNYITARGAKRLRAELDDLRNSKSEPARIAELEDILASVTIVEVPNESSNSVSFGAAVTIADARGNNQTYRIVGVNELEFEPNAVSWISPIGRILLAAELGDRVILPDLGSVKLVQVEYPVDA
ncbi:MAG: GreA/GreB family elongation factor [Burkholderiales bacterium]